MKHILIVSSSFTVADIFLQALNEAGYGAMHTKDTDTMCLQVESMLPDLAIIDQDNLPGSGRLIVQLRQKWPKLLIVAISKDLPTYVLLEMQERLVIPGNPFLDSIMGALDPFSPLRNPAPTAEPKMRKFWPTKFANSFLRKPVEVDALLALVSNLINGTAQHQCS